MSQEWGSGANKKKEKNVSQFNEEFLENSDDEHRSQNDNGDDHSQKTRNFDVNESKILAAKKGKRGRYSDSEEDFDEEDLFGDDDEQDEQTTKKKHRA